MSWRYCVMRVCGLGLLSGIANEVLGDSPCQFQAASVQSAACSTSEHEEAVKQDLDSILRQWIAARREVHSLEMKFTLVQTNSVFKTQTLGKGRLVLDDRRNGFYESKPMLTLRDASSHRTVTQHGRQYKVRNLEPTALYWSKDYIAMRHGSSLQNTKRSNCRFLGCLYEPDAIWGESVSVFFPPRLQKLKAQFQLGVMRQDGSTIYLRLLPNTNKMQACTSCVDIILNAHNYQTQAVRYYSPCGNHSDVYQFSEIQENVPGNLEEIPHLATAPAKTEDLIHAGVD